MRDCTALARHIHYSGLINKITIFGRGWERVGGRQRISVSFAYLLHTFWRWLKLIEIHRLNSLKSHVNSLTHTHMHTDTQTALRHSQSKWIGVLSMHSVIDPIEYRTNNGGFMTVVKHRHYTQLVKRLTHTHKHIYLYVRQTNKWQLQTSYELSGRKREKSGGVRQLVIIWRGFMTCRRGISAA